MTKRYNKIKQSYKTSSEKNSIETISKKLNDINVKYLPFRENIKKYTIDNLKDIDKMYRRINSYIEIANKFDEDIYSDELDDNDTKNKIDEISKLAKKVLNEYRMLNNTLMDKKIDIIRMDLDKKLLDVSNKTDDSIKKIEENVSSITFTIISIVVGISVVTAFIEVLHNISNIEEMIFTIFSAVFISSTLMVLGCIIFKGYKKEQKILYLIYGFIAFVWTLLAILFICTKPNKADIVKSAVSTDKSNIYEIKEVTNSMAPIE